MEVGFTKIYHEDNTIGYSIYFPVEEEEETTDVASVHPIIGQTHRLPLQKFVISKNKDEFASIEQTGLANLTIEYLKMLVKKYFNL